MMMLVLDKMNIIIESILVGFAIYSIFWSLGCKFFEKWYKQFLNKIEHLASIVFSIGGLLFVGIWCIEEFYVYMGLKSELGHFNPMDRVSNFSYWVLPLLYLISTQLLWIVWIRENRFFRFLIGFSMVITFEYLIERITALHRDYLPNSYYEPIFL